MIAVASGKGGVGKSTLTANLAYALSALGEQVGVLDGDIYGHSIPHMLGVHQKPIAVDEMIVPPVRGDLKLMSIGFFLEENAPIMWRGPMLHKALEQFLSDVHWGELDTLLVDMPPGTGDVAMSLGQLLPRAEALVVTTPQPAAQQVAVRAAQMAQKTGMRVLGVVENMSYLVGTGEELFGSGGGQALADEMGVPLLARIPLDPTHARGGRRRRPVAEVAPDSEAAAAIGALAASVVALARRHDPQAAHGSLVEAARAGRRVLRSRSNVDLALELAVARSGISPARASSSPRSDEGDDRPARLHAVRGGDVAGRPDGGERDGLPEGAARRGDARDRRRGGGARRSGRMSIATRSISSRGIGERGERSFIVSAALQEIVDALVSELDFDGGLGSTAEVEDGVYTGRIDAPPRRLCQGGSAARSSPSRRASTFGSRRRTPTLRATCRSSRRRSCGRRESRPEAACDRSRARLARAAIPRKSLPGPMTEADARRRLGELGLDAGAVDALVAHFADAERRGKDRARLRASRVAGDAGLRPAARPVLVESEEGFERWDGHGALGYLVLDEIVRATLDDPPERARVVVARRCFPTGSLGYWARRLAEGGLVAALTATSPRRLSHPDGGPPLTGTNPLAIAIPSSDGAPVVADVSMGVGDGRRRSCRARNGRTSSSRSAASTRTRPSRSP